MIVLSAPLILMPYTRSKIICLRRYRFATAMVTGRRWGSFAVQPSTFRPHALGQYTGWPP